MKYSKSYGLQKKSYEKIRKITKFTIFVISQLKVLQYICKKKYAKMNYKKYMLNSKINLNGFYQLSLCKMDVVYCWRCVQ